MGAEDRAPTDPTADEYTLDDYMQALYRRRAIIAFVTLSACVCAAVVSLLLPPIYESRAVFYVPRDILVGATDYRRTEGWQAAMPFESQRIGDVYARIIKGSDIKRQVHDRFPDVSLRDLNRSVSTISRQSMVELYVRDQDPERAAELANAFVDCFFEFLQAPVKTDSSNVLERIERQLEDAEAQLDDAIASKSTFLDEHTVTSPQTELAGLQERYLQLNHDLRSTEVERDALLQQIASLETQLSRQAGVFETGDLRQQLTLLRAEHDGIEARIEGIRKVILETRSRISESTEFAADLERSDELIHSYMDIKRSLEVVRNNLGIGALQTRQVGRIVETARPPETPVFPLLWFNTFVAGALGLMAGILFSLLLEAHEVKERTRELRRIEVTEWAMRMLEDLPRSE